MRSPLAFCSFTCPGRSLKVLDLHFPDLFQLLEGGAPHVDGAARGVVVESLVEEIMMLRLELLDGRQVLVNPFHVISVREGAKEGVLHVHVTGRVDPVDGSAFLEVKCTLDVFREGWLTILLSLFQERFLAKSVGKPTGEAPMN